MMSDTMKEMLQELYSDEVLRIKAENDAKMLDIIEREKSRNIYVVDPTRITATECRANMEEIGFDMVNNPPHYNQGGIETIDYMKAYSSKEEYQGHLRLTAIKYLSRSGKKHNRSEDLKKGAWYLNKLIEDVQERG